MKNVLEKLFFLALKKRWRVEIILFSTKCPVLLWPLGCRCCLESERSWPEDKVKHAKYGRTEGEKIRLDDDIEVSIWNESHSCPIPRLAKWRCLFPGIHPFLLGFLLFLFFMVFSYNCYLYDISCNFSSFLILFESSFLPHYWPRDFCRNWCLWPVSGQ